MKNWELHLGLYPGVLIGVRTYEYPHNEFKDHVLYLPFVDVCLTIYADQQL